ncbi:hypothetical protein NPS49_22520 [Pseudomonas putida]|uniref:hypothetical protein n=1 Tax=Pseudomonas putida TaxID=303 RepID=UPI0023648E8D|nr:hypothetical protein [Pseudomonas putida]EKT4451464.1 hypothetical protein [Pseudomonas putida]MDD2071074.1 hypothetical protein [Pseudomonas putida]HDS1741024.1 hypothetical protein [Pseudomonas putida]
MLWWLEILAQYATSTGLAVLCIFVFWAYGLAFGSVYMRLLSGLLAAMLLTIAACPHGVDFALGKHLALGGPGALLLFIADAAGVITAVVVASFFFSPGRLQDEP